MKPAKKKKAVLASLAALPSVAVKAWHWPFLRVNSNGAKEYACPHGVGHGGIHGCDGCCSDMAFPVDLPAKKVGVLAWGYKNLKTGIISTAAFSDKRTAKQFKLREEELIPVEIRELPARKSK